MNCVLFAKMDQVFSLGNRTLKKYWKNGKKYWKSQGKVREFCQSGKVGTLYWSFAEKTFVKQSMMLCAFEILLKIGRFGGGKSYRRFGGKSYLAI